MCELDLGHHVFRHVKKSWMDGDFIDPAAFRLRQTEDGQLEEGLSVNWVEYFGRQNPPEAVGPLCDILKRKRTIAPSSKFALLNVGQAKAAAATYTTAIIVHDKEPDDESHVLVKGYDAFNDEVAEELCKVVIDTFAAK
jgi:hypothetical protein